MTTWPASVLSSAGRLQWRLLALRCYSGAMQRLDSQEQVSPPSIIASEPSAPKKVALHELLRQVSYVDASEAVAAPSVLMDAGYFTAAQELALELKSNCETYAAGSAASERSDMGLACSILSHNAAVFAMHARTAAMNEAILKRAILEAGAGRQPPRSKEPVPDERATKSVETLRSAQRHKRARDSGSVSGLVVRVRLSGHGKRAAAPRKQAAEPDMDFFGELY